jgi:hypothetical protein
MPFLDDRRPGGARARVVVFDKDGQPLGAIAKFRWISLP